MGSGWLWGSCFSVHYSAPREEGKARLQGPCCQPGPRATFPGCPGRPAGRSAPGPGAPSMCARGVEGGGGRRRSVQAPVPSQPIGRTEKQDIVTRRGGESAGGGAGRPVTRTRGRGAGGGRRGASGARTRLSALGGAGGTRRSHALGPLPGAGFIFRFRRALRPWSGAEPVNVRQ